MDWHFSHALEKVADLVSDKIALKDDLSQRTWREYEDRAARIASALKAAGLSRGSNVSLLMHNCNAYLESHFAAFKIGGSPINVNYRYREKELEYLIENSDSEALIFHDIYSDVVQKVLPRLPKLKFLMQVPLTGDSAESTEDVLLYDQVIEENLPLPRQTHSGADVYILYTGGTTGKPKGVMFENGPTCERLVQSYRLFGMPIPGSLDEIEASLAIGQEKSSIPTSLVVCPLMHGTGIWVGAMNAHLAGGRVITISDLGFDAHRVLSTIAREKVTYLTIVGDVFAMPLLEALNKAREHGEPYDMSSVRTIISSGVMWSQEVKQGLLGHGDFTLIDAVGSTEVAMGGSVSKRGKESKTGNFQMNPDVIIIGDDGKRIEPGSDRVGRIGAPGAMIGYYKDEEKTRELIVPIDGVSYVVPGDYAVYEPDGSIKLLGRGSNCINTAGEKVFPEEVEEALKTHPVVQDCLVLGKPDSRFGQRVVAVVSVSKSVSADDLISDAKKKIAGYKVPKEIYFSSEVQRFPNGKPDYKWAKSFVQQASGG